jgi:hypothetical protein
MATDKTLVYPPQHAEWVELAIKKQAQSIAFRQAVIEKSTTALVWAGILGLGVMIKTWLNSVGLKI